MNPINDKIDIIIHIANPTYFYLVTTVNAKQNIPIINISNKAPKISNFVFLTTIFLCSHRGIIDTIDNNANIASHKNLY